MGKAPAHCIWCGALAVRDVHNDVGWVGTMAQAGCDHELLVGPIGGSDIDAAARVIPPEKGDA